MRLVFHAQGYHFRIFFGLLDITQAKLKLSSVSQIGKAHVLKGARREGDGEKLVGSVREVVYAERVRLAARRLRLNRKFDNRLAVGLQGTLLLLEENDVFGRRDGRGYGRIRRIGRR